jgi:hypothetical protein
MKSEIPDIFLIFFSFRSVVPGTIEVPQKAPSQFSLKRKQIKLGVVFNIKPLKPKPF